MSRVGVLDGDEQRKVVTALFCDLSESTALGERLDPEALRELLARYFEQMRPIVERHGGSVEKFIGDAVMAVFGVPLLHEDDALRACRAAVEMRDALPALGIRGRIGVNTGEVVAGTKERLATGDAINVAARLEQAAEPGEVLIGESTLALVRSAVVAEPAGGLRLKGKGEPVSAYRLLAVEGEPARRFASRMVGRERELQELGEAFSRAQHDRSCQLFTVLGSAGIGKSRLAVEFLSGLEARVVQGRCLSYGEGISYWPVVEIAKQLDTLPEGDPGRPLRSLLGRTDEPASAEEIAWGFRTLLEQQAQVQPQPLVVVLDDLHWAEETLLDLVEHVAELSRDAPILLLCLARPELLELRPTWGGGKWNATTVLLEPLDAAETDQLLRHLGGVPDELRGRILQVAEGNPLFLEEMLALVHESAGTTVEVPPTIRALLAARLDQLPAAERAVLERGSVEGHVFHRGAVATLLDDAEPVDARLIALVRKELVRPERPQLPDEDAYRFRHLLIRDAAYDALPKSARAELHRRFAAWLREHGRTLVELDEILGYHLAQAAGYLAELGRPDPQLAGQAGTRLAAAGRRALWRDDRRTAASLLERALALTRPTRLDVHLELDLAFAVGWLDPVRAVAIAEDVAQQARDAGDEPGQALARVVAAQYGTAAGDVTCDEIEVLARAALPLLERADDHAGLVHVWYALAYMVCNARFRFEDMAEAAEQALRHARLAGQRGEQNILDKLALALMAGPRPAGEALRTIDERLSEHASPHALLRRARLLAMLDRFDEARQLATEAGLQVHEFALLGPGETLAWIASVAGDHETAARHLRRMCDQLEEQGNRGYLSLFAPLLGRELCWLGRYDEAEPLAQKGPELGDPEDVAPQMVWRQTEALVHAHRGRRAQAEQLAREAVEIGEHTDALNFQGDALSDLAQVLEAAGRTDEAIVALQEALDRYERKQNIPQARETRERLATLQETPV